MSAENKATARRVFEGVWNKSNLDWTAVGTHTGELMGIAPTGKQVTVTGANLSRWLKKHGLRRKRE